MTKKTVWLVNEYNLPTAVKSRQTNLCSLLNNRGYDAYIISGSTLNKKGGNVLDSCQSLTFVETDEAKGFIVRTPTYHNSVQRALAALSFQRNVWRQRNRLPKPDVIVSDFAGLFGNGFLKWKKKYGTKIIFDILDLWPEGFVTLGYLKKGSIITKALYAMEHRSYRDADGIIFSMQGGRDYIIDKGWSKEVGGDVDTGNIGYLNNGVDLEAVDKQATEFVLEDPDLDSNAFKVVYLGSISATNGLDVLVETARVLSERHEYDISILVYGFGNKEQSLKDLVIQYGLQNIKFKGRLDKKYAMSVLKRADLNVFTFADSPLWKYGVSPNKLFMYFASGKPVLSLIQPKYDLVEGNKAGISIRNDPQLAANTILRFRDMDAREYDTYCRNARQTADEYDYKNLVQVLIDQIEA